MTTQTEALKLALEAHKRNERHSKVAETRYWCDQYKLLAQQAIEALAQPEHDPYDEVFIAYGLPKQEQEPVAWQDTVKPNELVSAEDWDNIDPMYQSFYRPLYTTPPQRTWVDLTDEEVLGLFGKFTGMTGKGWLDLYRMTEAKRKEKNT